MSAWLGRQRKPELVALAEHAGLDDVEGLRKDELVSLLDEHLQKNASRLSGNTTLREYYDRSGSPLKRNASATAAITSDGEVHSVVRARGRRQTKVKEEIDVSEPTPSSPAAVSTPYVAHSPVSHRAAPSSPLGAAFPPSPAAVTDAIETQTALLSAGINDFVTGTHVEGFFQEIRDTLSTVIGVEMTILLLEGFCLQRRIMPWRYAFDVPAVHQLGLSSFAVFYPDLFILLTGYYWGAFFLWAINSIAIPLAASWFWNLTFRPITKHGVTALKPRWRCDPLTFNVVKALMAWLVFSQGTRFWGLFADETVDRVLLAMPKGYAGVLIGAAIGVLASLYDAAQRK